LFRLYNRESNLYAMTSSSLFQLCFLLVALALAEEKAACADSPGGCKAGEDDPSTLIQTRVRIGHEAVSEIAGSGKTGEAVHDSISHGTIAMEEDVELEEEMLDDDIDLKNSKTFESWPEAASDMVCQMDAVEGPSGIQFSRYGVFEAGGSDITKSMMNTCISSNCVLVPKLSRRRTSSSSSTEDVREACQDMAAEMSHKHYAVGEEDGSLRCYTFADCEEGNKVAKSGFKLYSRPASTDEPKSAGMSCQGEQLIKEEVNSQLANMGHPSDETADNVQGLWWRGQATALRAVFHDAQDYNSLEVRNSETNEWEHFPFGDGQAEYGGIDGCVYQGSGAEARVAANEGFNAAGKILTNSGGSVLENFNLERLHQNSDFIRIDKLWFRFARKACENLCCTGSVLPSSDKDALCGTSVTCDSDYEDYMDKCIVDVMTLGSLLIIENNGGPAIPMTWGRKQGDCRKPFEGITVPDHLDTRRIAQSGAPLSSFGNPSAIFTHFEDMGMNKTEAVALMGAHSFGKIHKYTGGVDTRNRGGGFCTDLAQVQGYWGKNGTPMETFDDTHLDTRSTPAGTCTGDFHDASYLSSDPVTCWTNERGYLEQARAEAPEPTKAMLRKASQDEAKALSYVMPGWGKGGFWDRTPNHFDNDYFVLLNQTDASDRNNCCGPSTEYGCSADSLPMQNKDGEDIDGCDVSWCLRSGGSTDGWLGGGSPNSASVSDYAMLSTKEYVKSDIGTHHLYLLAADWALIEDTEAKDVVARFAADEAEFHAAFAAAWSKVINLGHSSLETCTAPAPAPA
jgi:hypothetical protein